MPMKRQAPLRIVVHDLGGYPFIVQLSRSLASRGHEVRHMVASGFRNPKGPMDARTADAPTLSIEPVELRETMRRRGIGRVLQERRYGARAARHVIAARPDVVISANSPLLVQDSIARAAGAVGAAFVFWVQDIHSVAISRIVGRRFGAMGNVAGWPFRQLEQRLLLRSDRVVAASTDYLPALGALGVPPDSTSVIENWSPLDDGVAQPTNRAWAAEHRLTRGRLVLYAGTLALKHDPSLLLELARGLPDETIAVVAEGSGADWLRARQGEADNLHVLPLQPFSQVSRMLGAADLLIAVLEPDASTFSAPSKVLTYLAAGRPILAAIPAENAAARTIVAAGAGAVADPRNSGAVVAAARDLLRDSDRLHKAGAAGRAYAEKMFDIEQITDRFEALLQAAAERKSHSPTRVRADTGAAQE
jgi:putative colanic acid biosynthesis glycosyltransferase WcaI